MPLTTSLNILDIVSENVGLLSGTPTWLTAEEWERNELADDSTFPFVYLSRPIINPIDFLKSGAKERTYRLKLMFAGAAMDLDTPISQVESTLSAMQTLMNEFENRLNHDSRIEEISNAQELEVFGLDDRNWYGKGLELTVKVVDNTSVCVS